MPRRIGRPGRRQDSDWLDDLLLGGMGMGGPYDGGGGGGDGWSGDGDPYPPPSEVDVSASTTVETQDFDWEDVQEGFNPLNDDSGFSGGGGGSSDSVSYDPPPIFAGDDDDESPDAGDVVSYIPPAADPEPATPVEMAPDPDGDEGEDQSPDTDVSSSVVAPPQPIVPIETISESSEELIEDVPPSEYDPPVMTDDDNFVYTVTAPADAPQDTFDEDLDDEHEITPPHVDQSVDVYSGPLDAPIETLDAPALTSLIEDDEDSYDDIPHTTDSVTVTATPDPPAPTFDALPIDYEPDIPLHVDQEVTVTASADPDADGDYDDELMLQPVAVPVYTPPEVVYGGIQLQPAITAPPTAPANKVGNLDPKQGAGNNTPAPTPGPPAKTAPPSAAGMPVVPPKPAATFPFWLLVVLLIVVLLYAEA